MNLKEKIYLYVNSTAQRCSKLIIKTFLIEDFFICHLCQRHRWCTLSCKYLSKFLKKFKTAIMVNSGALGKLIHKKTLKSKISWHCPFNPPPFKHPFTIFLPRPPTPISLLEPPQKRVSVSPIWIFFRPLQQGRLMTRSD